SHSQALSRSVCGGETCPLAAHRPSARSCGGFIDDNLLLNESCAADEGSAGYPVSVCCEGAPRIWRRLCDHHPSGLSLRDRPLASRDRAGCERLAAWNC